MLTSRGLGTVLGDLASMGFDARWGVLGAADIGANHQRDRIWIVAKWRGQLPHTQHDRFRRWEQLQESVEKETANLANTNSTHGEGNQRAERTQQEHSNSDGTSQLADTKNEGYVRWFRGMGATQSQHNHRGSQSNGRGEWWKVEPDLGRVADGVAARMDRLKAIGNGQVPLCAATAWRILSGD